MPQLTDRDLPFPYIHPRAHPASNLDRCTAPLHPPSATLPAFQLDCTMPRDLDSWFAQARFLPYCHRPPLCPARIRHLLGKLIRRVIYRREADETQVFGTPVMVDVATSLDAPIKLLAPRSSTSSDFALLGLGDIVIPGLMISLCLRFDLYRHAKFNQDEEVTSKSKFNRSYFVVGMISYVLGLGGCMWIMSYFGRAQPALLYLSPACSKSSDPHYSRNQRKASALGP
jgi:hypothetical protein